MAVRTPVKASALGKKTVPPALHAAVKTLPKTAARDILITTPQTVTHVTISPVVLVGGVVLLLLLSKR